MAKLKSYKIQVGDMDTHHEIKFNRDEMKRIYNALLIDHLSDDYPSDKTEQLLEKLKYYIEENGKH